MTDEELSGREDAELLSRVAAGDRGALHVLYQRHSPWLARRLANRCSDADVVASALQDTFVAVWKGARGYKGEGEVAAWIWGIGIRQLIGHLRKRPAMQRLSTRGAVVESAEERVLLGVEHGDLAGALSSLSPELRAVVEATVLDGLTTREAARLLGIPAGTVKTRMMRARAELRGALA